MIEIILVAVGAIIAAFFFGNQQGKKKERNNAERNALQDEKRRVDKGRDNVINDRDGRTPDQRVRENDSRW